MVVAVTHFRFCFDICFFYWYTFTRLFWLEYWSRTT